MTRAPIGDVLANGPCNGMGERDAEGSYLLLTISTDGEAMHKVRISRGCAQELEDAIHMILRTDIDRIVGSVIDAYTLAPNDEDEKRDAVRACLLRQGWRP